MRQPLFSGVGRGSDMRTVFSVIMPRLIHSCRMRARRFPRMLMISRSKRCVSCA